MASADSSSSSSSNSSSRELQEEDASVTPAAAASPPLALPPAPHVQTGSVRKALKLDPDVATLSLRIEERLQALTHDAVDHLMAVKARMQAAQDEAVADEHQEHDARLAAKQANLDAVASELQHTRGLLASSDAFLDRVSAGYAAKQQASKDKPNLLSCFYVWREWVQRRRRLAHLALRLQHWYVHRWLLGRAWDRWARQARLHYRALVAERADKQRQADAADLQSAHVREMAALRHELEGLQQQLSEEAAARDKMEEEMKRSFMRGVTAINLEALQMMRRGAPSAGTNPFPVAVPLSAASAAAGLTAAAAGCELQQEQALAGGEAGGDDDGGSGGLQALLSDNMAPAARSTTLSAWMKPGGQQQCVVQQEQPANQGGSAFAPAAMSWGAPAVSGTAAAPATASPLRHPALGAVVFGSPQQQQSGPQQVGSSSNWAGFRCSPGQQAAAAHVPKVFVERGPAAATKREAGVRRALPGSATGLQAAGKGPGSRGR